MCARPIVRRSEHDEQVAVIEWAEWEARQWPELRNLFAVPNAGQRHPAVGRKMRKEGLKRGVPDLFLDVPRGRYHGLRIEMKVRPNTLTPEQQDWMTRLTDQGYYVAVCYGAEPAIRTIKAYLQLGEVVERVARPPTATARGRMSIKFYP